MNNQAANTADEKFPAIDALRAFAALAVVACHCTVIGKWPPESLGWVARVSSYGWLGVDLFFVISGFVITNAALKLRHMSWRDYARVFWIRRAARILPLYYVTLIAFLVLIDHRAITGEGAFKQVVTHLLLIHQWWPETAGAINGVTWTLGIEVLFYLIAWLLAGLGVVAQRRGTFAIVLITLIAIAYRLLVFQLQTEETQRIFWANQVFGLLDGFMMGTAIAVWNGVTITTPDSTKKRSNFSSPFVLLAGLAVLVAAIVILDFHRSDIWQHRLLVGLFRTLVGLAFALMVLAAVQWNTSGRIPKSVRFLGDVSYGIYLWHLILLLWWQKTFEITGALLAMATVVSTLIVAAITYFVIERPCQRLGKSLTQATRQAAEPLIHAAKSHSE